MQITYKCVNAHECVNTRNECMNQMLFLLYIIVYIAYPRFSKYFKLCMYLFTNISYEGICVGVSHCKLLVTLIFHSIIEL